MWLEIKTSKVVAIGASAGAAIGLVMFETITPLSVLGPAGLVAGVSFVAIRHLKEKEQEEKDRLAREAFRKRVEEAKKSVKETVKEAVSVPAEIGSEAVQAGVDAAKVGAKIGSAVVGGVAGAVIGVGGKLKDLFSRKKDDDETPPSDTNHAS
jgi:outer membrane lipoprotein SlyB